MDIYYINGEFVPSDKACISVNDLALLRGYGIFDYLRTYNGRPFHLEDHVDRLAHSAELVGIDFRWSRDALCGIVTDTLKKNDHDESNIRIIVSGGDSEDSSEAFICGSSKEIVPVIKIDDAVIGNGAAGNRTTEIMRIFREYTNSYRRIP